MSRPSKPSKKHHFVPQAQLRHFAADADQRSIFVFDKQTDRSFRTSILNAGSENDFNSITVGEAKWNFEDLFREVDARSARLIGEIVRRRSLTWIAPTDRVVLVDLFATQLLRTNFSRTTPMRMAEHLREMVRQVGYDPDTDPGMAMPSDAALRLAAVESFLGRAGHAAAMLRLTPALYQAEEGRRFIISDHPVCVTNAFPYGEQGLSSHGVLVLLPVSPELTVVLVCPTITQRYEAAAELVLEPDRRSRMLRYRDGFRTGEPIMVDEETIFDLNRCQVARSGRYLYAQTDDFGFAREFLRRNASLRTVDTHVHMGEMGHSTPPRAGMPAGTHLVVFGPADHCMLAIEVIDETSEGLTARTCQIELLAKVASDRGMLRTELYRDGQVRRGIGQAMVERFGEPSEGWFRVVHRDPALRALGVRLDADLNRRRSAPPARY